MEGRRGRGVAMGETVRGGGGMVWGEGGFGFGRCELEVPVDFISKHTAVNAGLTSAYWSGHCLKK